MINARQHLKMSTLLTGPTRLASLWIISSSAWLSKMLRPCNDDLNYSKRIGESSSRRISSWKSQLLLMMVQRFNHESIRRANSWSKRKSPAIWWWNSPCPIMLSGLTREPHGGRRYGRGIFRKGSSQRKRYIKCQSWLPSKIVEATGSRRQTRWKAANPMTTSPSVSKKTKCVHIWPTHQEPPQLRIVPIKAPSP